MTDFIVIAILAVVIGAAVRYIYKAKKSGAKCIGCSAGSCSGCSGKKDAEASCCCHTDSAS